MGEARRALPSHRSEETSIDRNKRKNLMAKLKVGDQFLPVTLKAIDGVIVDFPAVFAKAPSTVVFFYRGRW
jgi:hypothetical protein